MPHDPAARARQVAAVLSARRIALVGASDRSAWSRSFHKNLRASPGLEALWLVNPGRDVVHGEPAFRSVLDVPGEIDMACVIVGAEGVLDALRPVAERGVRSALVLASGFAEAGPDGQRRSNELRAFADDHGIGIIGPNTAGLADIAGGVYSIANTLSPPFTPGPVGIVTQSGGIASQLIRVSHARGVGVRAVVGVGNELVLQMADVIRYYLTDEGTTVIAAYLEGFRDVAAFRAVAAEAATAGKPIVALKVGRTAASQALVASHTGALVGDDEVVDVAFRSFGVIRVDSIDALVATAGLLAHGPREVGDRIAVVSGSGATCNLMADRIVASGLRLASFSPDTVAALADMVPSYATPRNPLDATGAVVNDDEGSRRAVHTIAADPEVDAVVYQSLTPERFDDSEASVVRGRLAGVRRMVDGAPAPVILQTDISTDLSDELRRELEDAGLYVGRGYDLTIDAIARVAWWHRQRGRLRLPTAAPPSRADSVEADRTTWSEDDAMALLRKHDAPTVPAVRVASASEAVDAARSFGYPVVVKVAADGLAHKSDIGGVVLDVADDAAVTAAFSQVRQRGAEAAGDGADVGAVVAPMRTGGVELLVSVTDARPWGTLLTVGVGGIWVEALADTSSTLLPVDEDAVREMLSGLRSSAVLTGGRGRAPADLDAVAEAVLRIVDAAVSLGGDLQALEINPLLVDGSRVEALDALVITHGSAPPRHP